MNPCDHGNAQMVMEGGATTYTLLELPLSSNAPGLPLRHVIAVTAYDPKDYQVFLTKFPVFFHR
jgi:hypothetical protein